MPDGSTATRPALDNIQGFTIRPFGMHCVRHLILTVTSASGGRNFVGQLVSGAADLPQITPATDWGDARPDYALVLGITHDGLAALGLPQAALDSFPKAFREGAVQRAGIVGDTRANDPSLWTHGFNSADLHLIVSLYARTRDDREAKANLLLAAFDAAGAGTQLSQFDAHVFPDGKVHFGYSDGISNPNIEGMTPPRTYLADDQPKAPPGEFFLGYPSQFIGQTYPVPQPADLGRDGSYAAFRVLEQDVFGFEEFLNDTGARIGQDPEWVAAKLVGRWRNGNPLELTPDTDSPNPPIAREEINDYSYIAADPSDKSGFRCPIGSHMRRTNPRDESVAGGTGAGSLHRIMRRAMPYGPAYRPGQPRDDIKRGLIGYFLVGDLEAQFEFTMQQWVNGSIFTPRLQPGSGDPILSNNVNNTFQIPLADVKCSSAPDQCTAPLPIPQFVFTRGGAYCFVPSLAALRFIASGAAA